jgi:hypothetical protein
MPIRIVNGSPHRTAIRQRRTLREFKEIWRFISIKHGSFLLAGNFDFNT